MSRAIIRKHPVLIAVLLSSILLFLRSWDRFQNAHLWAEDGAVYLAQAYALGDKSLINLMDGYYQILPRLIAYIGSFAISIEYIPKYIFIVSLLVYSLMISIFASHAYRWLISSTQIRIIMVLALCLVPGLYEIIGNLANIATMTILILGILALKSLRQRYTVTELLIASLAIFTQGACILLFPVFGMRLYLKVRKNYTERNWFPEIFILFLILLATFINSYFGASARVSIAHEYFRYAIIEIRLFLSMFLVYPWLGDFTKEYFTLLLLPFFFPFMLRQIKMLPNVHKLVLLGAFSGLLAYPLLTFLVRDGAAAFYSSQLGNYTFSLHRYSFLLPSAGYIFGMIILSRTKGYFNNRKIFPLILTGIFVLLSLHRFFIDAYGTQLLWSNELPILKQSESTGCPNTVDVKIYPEGWNFRYTSPKMKAVCPSITR